MEWRNMAYHEVPDRRVTAHLETNVCSMSRVGTNRVAVRVARMADEGFCCLFKVSGLETGRGFGGGSPAAACPFHRPDPEKTLEGRRVCHV